MPKQHVTGAARLQARAAPGDEQTGFREKPFQSCAGARHSKSRLRKLGEHWHLSFMAAPPRQRAFSCDIQALIVQHLSFHLLLVEHLHGSLACGSPWHWCWRSRKLLSSVGVVCHHDRSHSVLLLDLAQLRCTFYKTAQALLVLPARIPCAPSFFLRQQAFVAHGVKKHLHYWTALELLKSTAQECSCSSSPCNQM